MHRNKRACGVCERSQHMIMIIMLCRGVSHQSETIITYTAPKRRNTQLSLVRRFFPVCIVVVRKHSTVNGEIGYFIATPCTNIMLYVFSELLICLMTLLKIMRNVLLDSISAVQRA